MKSYTYHELLHMQVINPAFEPKAIDYARAIIFKDDYYRYRRRKITTNKPYLWALAIQRTEGDCPDIPNGMEMMPKIKKALSRLKSCRRR